MHKDEVSEVYIWDVVMKDISNTTGIVACARWLSLGKDWQGLVLHRFPILVFKVKVVCVTHLVPLHTTLCSAFPLMESC